MLVPADVNQEAHRGFAQARPREVFGRLGRRLADGFLSDGDSADRLGCFGGCWAGNTPEACCRGFEIVEAEKISRNVGRCLDFDRRFLPVCSCLGDRWRSVDRVFREGRLPPVESYGLGGEHFVLDGNHRVSVARYRVVAVDAMVTPFLAPYGC